MTDGGRSTGSSRGPLESVAGVQVPTGLFIDGAWHEAEECFAVSDPADGSELAKVADGGVPDAMSALSAAQQAQQDWTATAPQDRAAILHRAHRLLLERVDEFAAVITAEMGKPLAEARGEVQYSADFLSWFAEEAIRVHGRYGMAPRGDSRLVTLARPVGVTLMVTPWNFPLAMLARKVAPALAAGCTAICKPAQETPLTALLFTQLLVDAGVGPGVVNTLATSHSVEVVAALLQDPRLRKITFTGSTATGKALVRQSADQLLTMSMELGGNAPFIVCADADLDAAVEGAMLAKMRNMGQACTAANRFLVHENVIEEFTDRLTARMQQLVVGPGSDPSSTVGPLITQRAVGQMEELVADALDQGAQLRCGGARAGSSGNFFAPTVLGAVPRSARVLNEEIFGPIAPVCSFTSDEEAVELANDTELGLAAYLFTKDLPRALWFGDQIEAGMVGVNRGLVSNAAAPFGGVKQSGYGREGGPEGIEEFLEVRSLVLQV